MGWLSSKHPEINAAGYWDAILFLLNFPSHFHSETAFAISIHLGVMFARQMFMKMSTRFCDFVEWFRNYLLDVMNGASVASIIKPISLKCIFIRKMSLLTGRTLPTVLRLDCHQEAISHAKCEPVAYWSFCGPSECIICLSHWRRQPQKHCGRRKFAVETFRKHGNFKMPEPQHCWHATWTHIETDQTMWLNKQCCIAHWYE